MLRRAPIAAFLHRTLLILLMLGACLQPAMAAVCDIEDARNFAAQDAAVTATAQDAGDAGTGNDCCANPACSDCCLHATAFPAQAVTAVVSPMPMLQCIPLTTDFRYSDDPVDIRPPIAG